MNKCEWCEERRYTSIKSTNNIRRKNKIDLYCLDLVKDENDYTMEINRQSPPDVYWEVLFRKNIDYCPFCGRKLRCDKE